MGHGVRTLVRARRGAGSAPARPLPCPTMRARSTLAALAAAVAALVARPGRRTRPSRTPRASPPASSAASSRSRSTAPAPSRARVTLSVKRVRRREQPDGDRRRRAGRRPGPGGAARSRPSSPSILGPALATRDLLVFDQRGTGSSGRLSCPAFERGVASIADAAAACANQLGPARGFYRTVGLGRRHRGAARRGRLPEARPLRRLLRHQGRARLRGQVPGQRRGARARLGRAARGLGRPERLDLQAMPRALGELCGNGACNGITTSVGHDLCNLVHRSGAQADHAARSTPPAARSLTVTLDQDGVLDILLAGDLNPTLRSELPGAMRSAMRGRQPPAAAPAAARQGPDRHPGRARAGRARRGRLRCALRGHALRGVAPSRGTAPPAPSSAPSQAVARRPRAPGHRLPALQLQGRAAQRGRSRVCVAWPNASPPPAPPAPLPAVPTLILAGGVDLRTPRRGRRGRRRADPGRPARRGAVHRPLGRRPATSATARRTRWPPSSRASRSAPVPDAPQVDPAVADRPDAAGRAARAHRRRSRRSAAVTATVRDVRLQFLGDEIAAGRATPVGARSAACAAATRPRPRAATTCAASSSCPASRSTASSRPSPAPRR